MISKNNIPFYTRGHNPTTKIFEKKIAALESTESAIALSSGMAAISTAIFKFIKIDDRKEEIYKMLQHFNDVETILNRKIKELGLIQSHFDDEMLFYNKNHIEDEYSQDENKNHIIEDDEELVKKKRNFILDPIYFQSLNNFVLENLLIWILRLCYINNLRIQLEILFL